MKNQTLYTTSIDGTRYKIEVVTKKSIKKTIKRLLINYGGIILFYLVIILGTLWICAEQKEKEERKKRWKKNNLKIIKNITLTLKRGKRATN